MSRHSGGKKKHVNESPPEEAEEFMRENAVALIRQRDQKIERLRKRISQLEKSNASFRELLEKLKL